MKREQWAVVLWHFWVCTVTQTHRQGSLGGFILEVGSLISWMEHLHTNAGMDGEGRNCRPGTLEHLSRLYTQSESKHTSVSWRNRARLIPWGVHGTQLGLQILSEYSSGLVLVSHFWSSGHFCCYCVNSLPPTWAHVCSSWAGCDIFNYI